MHINRISNTQFKGAYFIVGNGDRVKLAEEKIAKKLNKEGEIKKIGYGYTTNDMPTYLLVTTGEDVAKYNRFAATQLKDCYEKVTKQLPPKKTIEDFDTHHDFLNYRVTRKGIHTIEAISQYCNFANKPYVLDVEDVLSSIEEDGFDYLSGETA